MFRRSLLALFSTPAFAPASAQSWPSGPIRIIAPFPPGGSVDTIARLLVPSLQASLGVPVVVENRSGAAGALGTAAAARAAPDGQTWVLVFDSHATVNALNPQAGFDARRDFAPVMLVATAPMLLTTPVGRPWHELGRGRRGGAGQARHAHLWHGRRRQPGAPDHGGAAAARPGSS